MAHEPEADRLDYETALREIAEAVTDLAHARVALSMVAARFQANLTPDADAQAAFGKDEHTVSVELTIARRRLSSAALTLWSVRDDLLDIVLPSGALIDLERRLDRADRDLTAILPMILPSAPLLSPFYVAVRDDGDDAKPPTHHGSKSRLRLVPPTT